MLKAVSLNIKAPSWAFQKPSSDPPSPEEMEEWLARSKAIASYLLELDADLIFLQEVPLEHADRLASILTGAYSFHGHHPNPKRTSKIGCVTWWSRDRVRAVSHSTTSASVISALRLTGSTQVVAIANVHLKAGYRSGVGTRTSQLKSIFRAVGAGASVVVGDFNDDLALGDLGLSDGGYLIARPGPTWRDREFDLVAARGVAVSELGRGPEVGGSDHLPVLFTLAV